MDVAAMLREARLAAHLTQRQLAAQAGVTQSTVARIESGRMMPRVDTFDRLLRALGARLQSARIEHGSDARSAGEAGAAGR